MLLQLLLHPQLQCRYRTFWQLLAPLHKPLCMPYQTTTHALQTTATAFLHSLSSEVFCDCPPGPAQRLDESPHGSLQTDIGSQVADYSDRLKHDLHALPGTLQIKHVYQAESLKTHG